MMKYCLFWLNLFADLLRFLVLSLRSKSSLAAENLFLRKQLAFYQERRIKPRRTSHPTRLTLLWLSRWFDWRSALTVVTPKTFIGWHRKGFEFFWRRKCQSGRPRIPLALQRLIRRMARENPSSTSATVDLMLTIHTLTRERQVHPRQVAGSDMTALILRARQSGRVLLISFFKTDRGSSWRHRKSSSKVAV